MTGHKKDVLVDMTLMTYCNSEIRWFNLPTSDVERGSDQT